VQLLIDKRLHSSLTFRNNEIATKKKNQVTCLFFIDLEKNLSVPYLQCWTVFEFISPFAYESLNHCTFQCDAAHTEPYGMKFLLLRLLERKRYTSGNSGLKRSMLQGDEKIKSK